MFVQVLSAQSFIEIPQSPIFEGVEDSSIAFADVDGDSDQDVIITGQNRLSNNIARLYINNGLGNFTEMTNSLFEGVENSSVAFLDVDSDSDQDVIISGRNGSDTRITLVYTNDGMGDFTELTGTPFPGVLRGSIAFADVDEDSDQDVLITGELISELYTNDGMGNFTKSMNTTFEGVRESSIAFADVDGDSDQDVLITGENDSGISISRLYTNDGMGDFTEMTDAPFEGVREGSIAFADIDGDSDQDIFIAGYSDLAAAKVSKLYINDGVGNFIELMDTPFEGIEYSSIAFADVDGDSDQDILITGNDNSFDPISRLYLNNGIGNFTEIMNTPIEDVQFGSIAFADVDGDSDQDLLVTGFNSLGVRIAKLYDNDGVGNFAEIMDTPFEGVAFSSIEFSDVDNDFDQDVLIMGSDSSFDKIAKLYTNDGMGNFTELTGLPFDGASSGSIAFADVDSDSDQDLLITGSDNSFESISKLYINNGTVSSSSNFLRRVSLHLTLFPNPTTSDNLAIRFQSTANNTVMARIYDLNGQLISQQRAFVGTGEQTLSVNISSLPAGSYFVQVESGEEIGVAKFIVLQ
jgi:predicted nucleotidyltransferase